MNAGQFIQWQDLFVLVDDGSIPISRYAPIEAAIREQARTYPQGVALMCILPAETRPPPEEVKRYVKATLTRLAPALSSSTADDRTARSSRLAWTHRSSALREVRPPHGLRSRRRGQTTTRRRR